MIIYISGPITGDPDYKTKFNAAESYIGKWKEHIVLNPAMLPEGLRSHEDYMSICLEMVHAADAVVMLQGWTESAGAKEEHEEAEHCGKIIYYGIEAVPINEEQKSD